ncbi:hypothetical protein DL98DRAFT_648745 [Cadophora sp. DSE1049]|nr:hypothetical protein DL98DRAFT_648745 [Cadophora sp. DSE1049]
MVHSPIRVDDESDEMRTEESGPTRISRSHADMPRTRPVRFSARNIGPSRATRELWLEFERDLLFDILEEHLMGITIGRRWSKVNWNKVADTYNSLMAGTQQRSGERAAESLYRTKHKENGKEKIVTNISRGHRLTEDRIAPTRTAFGIRNQIKLFPHERIKEVIARAREEDERVCTASGWQKSSKKGAAKPDLPLSGEDDGDFIPEDDYPDGNQERFPSGDDLSARPENETIFEDVERLSAQQAYAEEERQIAQVTGPRQSALDRMGPNRLRGG